MELEQNIKLLTEAGQLDADCAEGAAEQLMAMGVGRLQTAEPVDGYRGLVLRVTEESGRDYYLGFGALGYLEIIRADAVDGEILYAPEE